jgi:hypothetical protein
MHEDRVRELIAAVLLLCKSAIISIVDCAGGGPWGNITA